MRAVLAKHDRFRCSSCGREARVRPPATSYRFAPHDRGIYPNETACPNNDAIPWGRNLEWALSYVCSQSRAGVRLPEWINSTDLRLWPGVTRSELSVALTYARRWRPTGFAEGQLPAVVTPSGLYG